MSVIGDPFVFDKTSLLEKTYLEYIEREQQKETEHRAAMLRLQADYYRKMRKEQIIFHVSILVLFGASLTWALLLR